MPLPRVQALLVSDAGDPFLTGLEAAIAIVEHEAMRHELNAQNAKDDLTRCYAMQRAWTCRDLAAMIAGKALPLRPIVLTAHRWSGRPFGPSD